MSAPRAMASTDSPRRRKAKQVSATLLAASIIAACGSNDQREPATDPHGGAATNGGAAQPANGGGFERGGTAQAGGRDASGGASAGRSDESTRGGKNSYGGSTNLGGDTNASGGAPSALGGAAGASLGGKTNASTGGSTNAAGRGGASNCTAPSVPAAKDSVTLDMAVTADAPTYRASGFIYGIAADASEPPNQMLSDIKVRHLRVGGAQLGCPNGGYVNGQYAARWNAVKAYYAKAKQVGATLLVLVHDIWGADAVCKVPRWPGANGDWTEYTDFMTQLMNDAKANGMTGPDVRWELWNEPDYAAFWGASQAQWLEMWKRGYRLVRGAIPDAVIEGPSLASGVGGWFNAFADYVKANDVVPNYVGWHEAGGGGDPVADATNARSALSRRGLDAANLDISEYGSTSEQTPGHSAWFIARLERAGVDGLRSNWGGGAGLYATMGGLSTSRWQPNGQWWIYKRYAEQSGLRTSVTAGTQVDALAYQDEKLNKAVVVVGNRGGVTGAVNVVIKNIPPWLADAGSMRVVVEKMPGGSAAVTAPTVSSDTSVPVMCGAATVTIQWTSAADGYAITLGAK